MSDDFNDEFSEAEKIEFQIMEIEAIANEFLDGANGFDIGTEHEGYVYVSADVLGQVILLFSSQFDEGYELDPMHTLKIFTSLLHAARLDVKSKK